MLGILNAQGRKLLNGEELGAFGPFGFAYKACYGWAVAFVFLYIFCIQEWCKPGCICTSKVRKNKFSPSPSEIMRILALVSANSALPAQR